jgi:ABC-2 type transport system permease protein
MRFDQAWVVTRHDMALIRQRRGVIAGLIAYPIGVGVGFPALVAYFATTQSSADPGSWLPGLIDAFSFWFVIAAASLPTVIAAYSIVGEKVEKSLEPLLATPTTDSEILFGKSLAAFLPTMAALWSGAVLYMVLMDLASHGALGYYYYPNSEIAVILLVVAPLACLVAIEASVLISSRVTDVRSAQQYAGVIFLPLIALYVAGEVGFNLGTANLLIIGGIFAVVVLALFAASVRSFHREEILTRWR